MRISLRLAMAGVLALAIVILAAPADRLGAAGPLPDTRDQLDYVFFASDRPVLIRVHLRLGDKPYSAAWDAWMDKIFVWFDKDGDGFLSSKEAARLPHPNSMQNMLNGGIGGGNQTVPFVQVDTNKDGKVSKEEFRDYYKKNGFSPLRFSNSNYQATQSKQTNDAIYKRLGLEPTGKLTKEKLARLPGLLFGLDENEDEMLSPEELKLEAPDPYGYARPVPPRRRGMPVQTAPVETGLIEISKSTTPAALAQMMLARYDKNKDGKLARTEVALEKALFDKLDANHDGLLDASELAAFFKQEPDLVFQARVGNLGTVAGALSRFGIAMGKSKLVAKRVEVVEAKTRPMTKKVRRVNDETFAFQLGDSRFDFQANQGQMYSNFEGIKQFYLQQFDAIVDKKKGYVDRKQEKENAMQPFLFFIFAQADRNADGKLTRKELEAYLNVINEGATSFVSFNVEDHGRSLFNIIDGNGDGRLSIREMRTAWDRVKPLCKDGTGLVQAELHRTLRVSMGQGYAGYQFATPVPVAYVGMPYRPGTPVSAPAWFLKMDRNGDGDISPREWLGTEEEFRMIDTDGDGLISAEEARQYEARRKKTEPAKKPEPPQKPAEPPTRSKEAKK
jgi:Ca2+-binding EF-hand superfamily protein